MLACLKLYTKTCPRTCPNFKALCTGEKGVSESTGVKLSYINALIHRVVPGGWIQGGDIADGPGSRGESIYGATFDGKYLIMWLHSSKKNNEWLDGNYPVGLSHTVC